MFQGHLLSLLLAATAAAPSSAVLLYATSYNDHAVTTLDLDVKSGRLTTLSKSLDCGSEPTWLTLNKADRVLYCLNEGWGGNSSITSYRTTANGTLATLDVIPVLKSPVSSTLYGPGKSGLAVAHYDTSTFSTFSVGEVTQVALSQNETYELPEPGPVPDRQDAPHLHDAVLDPTGRFIIVPDLGADTLHVYSIVPGTIKWVELEPVKAVPGNGPRHGVFAVTGDHSTFFYVANELSNTITGYKVEYEDEDGEETAAPVFTQLFDISTHGEGGHVPNGTKAAELEISPDNRFLLVSSRGENLLEIPSFDSGNNNSTYPNTTSIPSDPIVTFAIDGASGLLGVGGAPSVVQEAPAGGRNPRGFSLNRDGTLVASALQDDNRVVVYERDVVTGELGRVVAWASVGDASADGNGPNYVLFDD